RCRGDIEVAVPIAAKQDRQSATSGGYLALGEYQIQSPRLRGSLRLADIEFGRHTRRPQTLDSLQLVTKLLVPGVFRFNGAFGATQVCVSGANSVPRVVKRVRQNQAL